MKVQFLKMQGAGNDYIYVNEVEYPIACPEKAAIEWSRPHTGIGSDGLVLIGSSDKADFRMRIFNADGSEAKMCQCGWFRSKDVWQCQPLYWQIPLRTKAYGQDHHHLGNTLRNQDVASASG